MVLSTEQQYGKFCLPLSVGAGGFDFSEKCETVWFVVFSVEVLAAYDKVIKKIKYCLYVTAGDALSAETP